MKNNKQEKGMVTNNDLQTYIVFITEKELIVQSWNNDIEIDWPKKGKELNNKVIKLKGEMQAVKFKEYHTRRKENEPKKAYLERVVPGLTNILFSKQK